MYFVALYAALMFSNKRPNSTPNKSAFFKHIFVSNFVPSKPSTIFIILLMLPELTINNRLFLRFKMSSIGNAA